MRPEKDLRTFSSSAVSPAKYDDVSIEQHQPEENRSFD